MLYQKTKGLSTNLLKGLCTLGGNRTLTSEETGF